MNLERQHVVLFGGSSGIGLGVARSCLARGARVTLVGRSEERLSAAARSLDAPSRVATIAGDVTREEDLRSILAREPIHHVVLTAVDPYYRPVRELEAEGVNRVLASKLLAPMLLAKHARLEPSGSLLFTGGVAADRPGQGSAAIAAANGGLVALVRALALELAPSRVNLLSPGWIDTPVWERLAREGKAKLFEAHGKKLPVGRVGTPDDVGEAAAMLLANGFITGEVLHIDGGHRLV